VRLLVRQHRRYAVLLDPADRAVGDQVLQAAAEIAEHEARLHQVDDDVAFAADARALRRVEILHVLPCPAVAGLAGMPGQLRRRDREKFGMQRGTGVCGVGGSRVRLVRRVR